MNAVVGIRMSPLQSAREWRGMSLVAASRAAGLSLETASALEAGEISAFEDIHEMIAVAVTYAATFGIGREEALALLDRTTRGDHVVVNDDANDGVPVGNAAFSQAVRSSSDRRVASRSLASAIIPMPTMTEPLPGFDGSPETGDTGPMAAVTQPGGRISSIVIPSPSADAAKTGQLDTSTQVTSTIGITPFNDSVAMAANLDPAFKAAIVESRGELEEWAARHQAGNGRAKISGGAENVLKKMKATAERASRSIGSEDRAQALRQSTANGVVAAREWLRRSQYATLLVAMGAGIVLIALLVAFASLMGGGDKNEGIKSTTGPKVAPPTSKAVQTGATFEAGGNEAGADAEEPAVKPTQILKPAQISVNVLNAGHKIGEAARVAQRVKGNGYQIGDVGNSRTRYAASVILAPKSLAREAERLAKQTRITTMDTVPEAGGKPSITIVVV